jgi:hypothetical protein
MLYNKISFHYFHLDWVNEIPVHLEEYSFDPLPKKHIGKTDELYSG